MTKSNNNNNNNNNNKSKKRKEQPNYFMEVRFIRVMAVKSVCILYCDFVILSVFVLFVSCDFVILSRFVLFVSCDFVILSVCVASFQCHKSTASAEATRRYILCNSAKLDIFFLLE